MKFILEPYNHGVKDRELLADLKRVAKYLRKNKVSRYEYEQHGRFASGTIRNRFSTWNNAIEKAGLEPVQRAGATRRELFDNLEEIWLRKKRQPSPSDIKRGYSKFSITPYLRLFGSWRKALTAFAEYINNGKIIPNMNNKKHSSGMRPLRRTRKHVPKRMRYLVIERDNYRCRACGRSPATERGVKLHIDHIIPWSKGGETSPGNLQTLCGDCNIGKGDLHQLKITN